MENKEKIYDEQIAPLMAKIIEICKKEDIAIFAEFQIADNDFCTTLISNKNKHHCLFPLLNALISCMEGTGINIDKFYIWLSQKYSNKSSVIMKLLGKEPTG